MEICIKSLILALVMFHIAVFGFHQEVLWDLNPDQNQSVYNDVEILKNNGNLEIQRQLKKACEEPIKPGLKEREESE